MASDSDSGPTLITSLLRMTVSSRGALRWAAIIQPSSGGAYGAVLYYDPDRRRWAMARSARLTEKAQRLGKQETLGAAIFKSLGTIPAGEKVTAAGVAKFLPKHAHAEAAVLAMKRSRQ